MSFEASFDTVNSMACSLVAISFRSSGFPVVIISPLTMIAMRSHNISASSR